MNKLYTTYRVRQLFVKQASSIPPTFDRSCKDYGTGRLLWPQPLARAAPLASRNSIRGRDVHTSWASQRKDSYLEWMLSKFGIKMHKYVLAFKGVKLYDSIVNNLDYSKFYKEFNMADTFFSWFLVTELHVWMLTCRIMADKKDGKELRQSIVNRMWDDVNTRVKLLGDITASIKRKQLTEISQQFNAAMIEYDEGIMSDDKVLAGAIWRTFFSSECNNPESIEKLIMYMRRQISLLDKLPLEEILREPCLKWLDIKINR